jgi:hypothetical protein
MINFYNTTICLKFDVNLNNYILQFLFLNCNNTYKKVHILKFWIVALIPKIPCVFWQNFAISDIVGEINSSKN